MFRICGEMIEAQWRFVWTAMGALAPAADVVGGFGQQLAGAGLRGGTEAANAVQEAAQEAARRERRTATQLTEPVKGFESPPGQARVDLQDLAEAGSMAMTEPMAPAESPAHGVPAYLVRTSRRSPQREARTLARVGSSSRPGPKPWCLPTTSRAPLSHGRPSQARRRRRRTPTTTTARRAEAAKSQPDHGTTPHGPSPAHRSWPEPAHGAGWAR